MEFSQIADLIVRLLDLYGIVGAVMLLLFILVIKFGNRLVEVLADKAVSGKLNWPGNTRKIRKDSIFKINRVLTELMQKTKADHAALFEYHNGGYNLTGMPFLHFSLSIQRNSVGVQELSKDFDNVLVSSVPEFIRELDCNDIYYVNDIKIIEPTFPRLYRQLKEDQMEEVLFCTIQGLDDEVGFLMLSFKTTIGVKKRKIQKELFKKVQKISTLLDLKNIK